MMKKTLILAGFALVAAFTSCNKSEMPDTAPTEGIKLNISVADMNPETKAVKAGWVKGDKLNLFFEGFNNSAPSNNYQAEPDMVLAYDGTNWKIESQVSTLSDRLTASGGKFTALWESGNNLMGYNISWYNGGVWYKPSATTIEHNKLYHSTYHAPMSVYSPGVEYTFDGSTLTANISSWTFYTQFKVLVKTDDAELKGKANVLVLQVKVGEDTYADAKGAIIADKAYATIIGNGSSNYFGFQGAVAESDGLAFYYQSCNATASDTIVFSLIDTSDGAKKTYSVSGKTLSFSSSNPFKAISIDYSNFE